MKLRRMEIGQDRSNMYQLAVLAFSSPSTAPLVLLLLMVVCQRGTLCLSLLGGHAGARSRATRAPWRHLGFQRFVRVVCFLLFVHCHRSHLVRYQVWRLPRQFLSLTASAKLKTEPGDGD